MGLPVRKKERIPTERLVLKPYSSRDVGPLVRLLTHDEVTKTFMVPDFQTADQAVELAQKLIAFSRTEDVAHLEYGIYRNDHLIGFVNDCGIEGDEIEIGYVIDPDEQGHGFATEAVRAVISELRDMGFRKVRAGFFAENAASRRVMEKCGMKPIDFVDEEEYRGVLHSCRYFEICF